MRLALPAVSIAVLWWRFDLADVPALLGEVEPRLAVLGLAAFTASKVVHTFRWRLLLPQEAELSTRRLLPVFLLSNMLNALLPFRAGDVFRVEIPSRRFHVGRGALMSSVFIVETATDWVAFAVLLGATALTAEFPSALRPLVAMMAVGALGTFVAAAAVARSRPPPDLSHHLPVSALPRDWRPGAERGLIAILGGMQSLRDNRHAALAVGMACIAWATELPVWWLLARAFGFSPSLPEALVLMTAANFVVSLPLTPWDLGTYELVVAEAYALMGAGRSEAAAFAIGSHLMLHAWIGVTGIVAMWWLGLGPSDLAGGQARRTPP